MLLAVAATCFLLLSSWLVRKSIVDEFGGEPRLALGVSSKIANGDLTQAIPLQRDDRSSLLFVLAHMQSSLKEMLRAIFINANKVQASVERLSAESNEINLATQVQAGAVRYTRSAIADVSASVEVVNGLVHATENGANEVARRAHDGAEEDFPHVHISNFYFSFNEKFTEKYGTYRNVVSIAKTEDEAVKQFKLPYFVFKFHHKHFLIAAYPIRNEMLDPIRKVKGVWTYSTGLYNVADFIKEFPENPKQHVHQFNLSKLDATRLLHIW